MQVVSMCSLNKKQDIQCPHLPVLIDMPKKGRKVN